VICAPTPPKSRDFGVRNPKNLVLKKFGMMFFFIISIYTVQVKTAVHCRSLDHPLKRQMMHAIGALPMMHLKYGGATRGW